MEELTKGVKCLKRRKTPEDDRIISLGAYSSFKKWKWCQYRDYQSKLRSYGNEEEYQETDR